jgi:hypothetical protein
VFAAAFAYSIGRASPGIFQGGLCAGVDAARAVGLLRHKRPGRGPFLHDAQAPPALSAEFAASIEEKLAVLATRAAPAQSAAAVVIAADLPYVWACSSFAADACLRDTGLLQWLGVG